MSRLRFFALGFLIACAPTALAGRVEIPLRVPFELIRQALGEALVGTSEAPQALYRDGPCRYFKLDAPQLDAVGGRLRLVSPAIAALGVPWQGNCQSALFWRGSMHFTLAPQLDHAGRLRLRILDSRLVDADGQASALALLWDLSKRHVHPRLARFSYDIGALRAALLAIVRSAAPPERKADLERFLAQLRILDPRLEADALVFPAVVELPDAWLAAAAPPTVSTAPLSEAELDTLDEALQPWDAFLVYSIKHLALESDDGALRERLFTLLLASRYHLAAILSGEARAAGDPLRALFTDAWNDLRSIVADGQRAGALDASVLRYALFIEAGDALAALDRAAPGLGVRISADTLRQLARSLRPDAGDDPLAFAWAVDPQLRRLFGIEGIADPPPAIPAPAPPPPRRTTWLDHLIPSADASPTPRALDTWVPKREELRAYQARIGQLLQKTATIELHRGKLVAPYDRIYRHLLPATALIESCWRQYVVRRGKITYLRSAAGSVGIMQINQRVWRGFYDVQRLRWDTAYNARAGAQILLRYMKTYAIPYARRTGDEDHVARAAYAVYNAGPRAVGRFNKAQPHPREERVDRRLWKLYQGIVSGGQADLRTCGVAGPVASQ